MAKERIVSAEAVTPQDEAANTSLRPQRLDDYVGQAKLIEKVRIGLEAAQGRQEPMDHVLLHGPPGLGKTTLSHIIANEMGTRLTVTSGPAINRPTDLVGTLTKLGPRDVLFIDEIHRLSPIVEEYLYPAMEDFKIDVKLDQGMHAKPITLPIKPFTLIGATTRAGMLSGPMRSRFGVTHSLDFYGHDELLKILRRSASLLKVEPEGDALDLIASRSRGTPRIANRLLRRVRDFAQVRMAGRFSKKAVEDALKLEGVDELGLDELDRKYLRVIGEVYGGGPVGVEAIAATLGEDSGTLEEVSEPYLLQIGFLARTRRGRQLTRAGAEHVGIRIVLPEPEAALFDSDA